MAESETEFKVGTWYPIESAPRDGQSILVLNNHAPGCPNGVADECWAGNTAVAQFWGCEGWVCYMDRVQDPALHFDPTHWMPLPLPPQSE